MQAQRQDLQEVVSRFKPSDSAYQAFEKFAVRRYAIYSDNDHLNPQQELERYAEKIKAQKVFVKGIGHCGRKSGVKELPEVIRMLDED